MTTTISRSRLGQLVSATGQEFSFDTLVSRLTHMSICVQYDMSILDTIWVHVVDALDNDLLCYTDIRGEAYHYLLVASSFLPSSSINRAIEVGKDSNVFQLQLHTLSIATSF